MAVARGDLARRARRRRREPCERNTTRSHTCSTSLMSWLVISSAQPYSRERSSSPVRTRNATSGSSDAVGSSSTSRRGRCNVARTIPMSVRCPDESSVPIASARCSTRKRREPFLDLRRRVGEPVELAVQLQVLAHAHALGERQVARREPDERRGVAALLRERVAADRDRPRVRADDAEDHQQRRRLARAVRTEQRDALTRVHDEVDAVDRARPPVVLDEPARFEHDVGEPCAQRTRLTLVAPGPFVRPRPRTHPLAMAPSPARYDEVADWYVEYTRPWGDEPDRTAARRLHRPACARRGVRSRAHQPLPRRSRRAGNRARRLGEAHRPRRTCRGTRATRHPLRRR